MSPTKSLDVGDAEVGGAWRCFGGADQRHHCCRRLTENQHGAFWGGRGIVWVRLVCGDESRVYGGARGPLSSDLCPSVHAWVGGGAGMSRSSRAVAMGGGQGSGLDITTSVTRPE